MAATDTTSGFYFPRSESGWYLPTREGFADTHPNYPHFSAPTAGLSQDNCIVCPSQTQQWRVIWICSSAETRKRKRQIHHAFKASQGHQIDSKRTAPPLSGGRGDIFPADNQHPGGKPTNPGKCFVVTESRSTPGGRPRGHASRSKRSWGGNRSA